MRTTTEAKDGFNPFVSIGSKVLVASFVIFCAAYSDQAARIFTELSTSLLNNMKWFILLSITAICFFLIYVMFSRYGDIKLGNDSDKPEYSNFAWLSMLFSCAMGVGLVFWGVAEPINHYISNPFTKGLTDDAASMALQLTFFHWGLHAWSVYCIAALAIGYFSYRKGLPFSIRSVLHPLIGDRINGPIGNIVDLLVIVITTFGISQTLAIGVLQINTGLNKVFGIQISVTAQFIIMIALSSLATISVVRGIGTGMRRLSELNILLSIALILILMFVGPARYITNSYLEGLGNYSSHFISMSLWSNTQADSQWQNWWTAFYWLWWSTWAPFVGMFIAKISKGRSIRQLISGVLIVPTLVTFMWMSVFGGSALKIEKDARHAYEAQTSALIEKNKNNDLPQATIAQEFTGGPIVQATKQDNTLAVFSLFDEINKGVFGTILSITTCLLLITYLVTSQDGGTHVLCFLDTRSEKETPIRTRLIWCGFVTAISLGLLYIGGLKAIQAAVTLFGFPIIILLVLMCFSLQKAFKKENITSSSSSELKIHQQEN
ncbi:BCCT family transporter [Acinetobacter sp. R933-2]|uniref:BCCT family transporter n=1 Tax=unclassified Acinetobacter TaxID=196816 RepID=UPI00257874EC|nr:MULTISPECIES: BCCT family transporter [unclassified Acinetobacter]MDM1247647.1 BCCT family transporter [Acinetobacter sp. R933-2]MDM1769324.1 BCCT family transporter [Acinetobacter sp. 226-4]